MKKIILINSRSPQRRLGNAGLEGAGEDFINRGIIHARGEGNGRGDEHFLVNWLTP